MSLIPSVLSATETFLHCCRASGASERANYQLFLTERCELPGMEKPRPAPATVHEASYSFERPVLFDDGEGKKEHQLH